MSLSSVISSSHQKLNEVVVTHLQAVHMRLEKMDSLNTNQQGSDIIHIFTLFFVFCKFF